MIRILHNLLAMLGFTEVDDARDGEVALRMAKRRHYALIICDLQMSGMSGQELLRAVREDAGLARTPFIMIGAAPSAADVATALEADVDGFIAKPFSAKMLREKIDIAYSRRMRGAT
ncbi:response regulator [Terrarubrum flagellatum]|uniref:response regulator n=1 Tax=Terrirubrum flagellatum TaxID=2895980 RepID=UPI003144F0D4